MRTKYRCASVLVTVGLLLILVVSTVQAGSGANDIKALFEGG